MKKLLALILCVVLALSMSVSSVALASDEINVTINGVKQNYDVMPVIVDGRTLVPMRAIFESLGAEVGWIDHSKTVTGTRNNKTVKLNIDENLAYINRQETILDVPATIINSRTMVPVRFISEMLGEKVEWDAATKTVMIDSDYVRNVAIQPGLKPLTNNIHRNIPREFKTSSNYEDIFYYDNSKGKVELPSDGVVLSNMDNFISAASKDPEYGIVEKAVVDGEDVAKITVKKDMKSTSSCIFNLKKLTNFKENDTLVLSFDVKLTEPSEKTHYIQVQLQEETSGKYNKNIWQTFKIDTDWRTYVYGVTAKDGYDSFGFRPGMYKGEVLVKNFKIVNYGNQITADQVATTRMPLSDWKLLYEEGLQNIGFDEEYDPQYSSKDAQWRKEAFERIEQHRKGDFKVVVKDKDGNVIPDADVKFSMFESEYKIGTAIDGNIAKVTELQDNLNKYFNTVVNEHHLKWGPYVEDPSGAQTQIDWAKKLGMKHIRGHAFVWEKPMGSDGKTPLVPTIVLKDDGTVIDDKELLQKQIKEWIYRLAFDFAGEIDEWDVVNEITSKFAFRDKHGDDMMKDWFEWAKEGTTTSRMVYNDFAHSYSGQLVDNIYENMVKYAKYFKENNVPVDTIGFQSHEPVTSRGKFWFDSPEVTYNVFKLFTDMGYNTVVTEYSHDTPNEKFQAEFLRDYYIVAFSVPENLGFTFWEFWDTTSFAKHSPIFRDDWTMHPAGEILFDLVYNKFWTHDTTVKTSADGSASIRGFYGDYDVTVTHNGKTKTLSCAYHKGYDNVLEFVIE